MHFHFDWSINIGTVCAILMLIITIVNYGSKIVTYLQDMNYKVERMWLQFKKDHPELVL